MNEIVVLFFLILYSFQQFQQCTLLHGSGEFNSDPFYREKGIYNFDNTIGGRKKISAFAINNETEVLIFFGDNNGDFYDDVWKFSLQKKQWMFLKGRKENNQSPIFNETTEVNTFSKEIEVGSRIDSKGWIDQDERTITFFGGNAYTKSGRIICNEMWMFNISTNQYAVIHYNDETRTNEPVFGTIEGYQASKLPRGRIQHLLIKISEEETFLIGGYAGMPTEHFSDWWMFSTTLMQWNNLSSIEKTGYEYEMIYGETGVYHSDNFIGFSSDSAGTLINQEEILMFGGLSRSIIFCYNITSNMWKYVSGGIISGGPSFSGEYGREYNTLNFPGGRSIHGLFQINNDEIIIFGGQGRDKNDINGLLNDLWQYSIEKNQWKYIGKEKSKSNGVYSYVYPDSVYSNENIIGGIKEFAYQYLRNNNQLFIFGGNGHGFYEKGDLDNAWKIFLGNICDIYEDSDPNVCLGRGSCVGYNICECKDGWFGLNCELSKCEGVLSNETGSVCSGKGICFDSKCLCYEHSIYNNPDCSINEEQRLADLEYEQFLKTLWIYITVPVVVISLLIVFIVVSIFFIWICCQQKKKLKKFDEIEDVDIILEEQKIAKDTSVAQFKINQKMFEIDSKDVKIIEKIGKGGSSAFVYSAMWNKQKVAFKCFIVQEFLGNAKFHEFEKEVELLSSISYPHILTFYGATLNSQRLGFVMEYAENGDLEHFLKEYKKMNGFCYPFRKKIRMLNEISSAMLFLHNKNIIHRDLKPLNVLVTSKEETKLMDFGLSKIIDNELITKTKKVGTSFYMAPEVVTGEYSYPCDVFSFAMLVFVVLTENFTPFERNSSLMIINRMAKDPQFRPDLYSLEVNKNYQNDIKLLIHRNWDHKPSKRMKFDQITEFFIDLKKKLEKEEIKEELPIKKESKTLVNWEEELKKKDKEIEELKKINQELIKKLNSVQNSEIKK